jgi:hypothetical protein
MKHIDACHDALVVMRIANRVFKIPDQTTAVYSYGLDGALEMCGVSRKL